MLQTLGLYFSVVEETKQVVLSLFGDQLSVFLCFQALLTSVAFSAGQQITLVALGQFPIVHTHRKILYTHILNT